MTTATVSDTTLVGHQVEFMEGLELMSTEVAGPVTTHSQLLPEGDHSSVGGHGSLGSVSSSLMGVTLGYPSEHTDPRDRMIASTDEGQGITGSAAMATSVATAGTRHTLATTYTSRQPPTVTDTETAAATTPTQVVVMDETIFGLFALLGFINPSVNPFIYAARYEPFRRALKQMLGRGDEGSSQEAGAGSAAGHAAAATTQSTRRIVVQRT